MKRKLKLLVAPAILAVVLVGSGCGSATFDNQLSQTTGSSNPSVAQAAQLSGRFFLGAGVANATIQVIGGKSQVLATTTSNGQGFFSFPATILPENFRVTAQIDSQFLFASEVRGFDQNGRYVVINVPTSLVSAYLQSQTDGNLSLAEARVAALLAIPNGWSLEYGLEETTRSPFSHIVFFSSALQQGGWPQLRDRLVGQIGSSSPNAIGPFLLSKASAGGSLVGLNPALQSKLEQLRATPDFRRMLLTSLRPVPNFSELLTEGGSTRPGAIAKATPEIRPRVLDSIVEATLEAVGDEAKKQLVDVGWTHIADALNLNYGTTRMLEVIQDQLIQVLSLLADLSTQISQDNLQQANNDLATQLGFIDTVMIPLRNANGGTDGLGGTPGVGEVSGTDLNNPGTPYSLPPDVTTLLNALSTFITQSSLDTIQKLMLGTGGTTNILTSSRDAVNSKLGLISNTVDGHAPFRNNDILAQMLESYQYYSNYQLMACYAIGENAHVTSANPSSDMQSAAQTLTNAVNSLKQQRGQLPQYLASGDVIVDMQGGLMWYRYIQSSASPDNALSQANAFQLNVANGVTYTDWHYATPSELTLLQDRARLVATNLRDGGVAHDGSDSSYGNYGYSAQGLRALGFQGDDGNSINVDSDGDFLCYDPGYVHTIVGDNYWQEGQGKFQFNHEHTPFLVETSSYEGQYFLVRTIGQPCLNETTGENSQDYHFAWSVPQNGEYAYLGYLLQMNQGQVAAGVNNLAEILSVFRITVGGSFTLGNGSTGDSYSLPQRNYDGPYTSNLHGGTTADFSGDVNLNELIAFSSGNPAKVGIGVNAKLFWHNDASSLAANIPFTASALNTLGQTISGSGTLVVNPTPVRSLRAIQIFGRNKRYDMTATTANNDLYYCLAYYDDNTVQDVTASTIWSVALQGGGTPSAAHFSSSSPNELVVSNAATETLTITATFQGPNNQQGTDSCSALVYNN